MNTPFYVFMLLLPKNAVSRVFGFFTRLHLPWISAFVRDWFVRKYNLDMSESEKPAASYPNLAALFIRKLKPNARLIASEELVSPVDGVLSQTGVFDYPVQKMIQAKGKYYTLPSLLRDSELAAKFEGGAWATIYLAPFNYHRIHSPVKGRLISAHYCPGELWPVNKGSVCRVEGLFAINERLTSLIRADDGGDVLLVKVGATNVGRIVVNYAKDWITNAGKIDRKIPRSDFIPENSVLFEKGDELGRFEMGSTVILVVSKEIRARHPHLFEHFLGKEIRMGESLLNTNHAVD